MRRWLAAPGIGLARWDATAAVLDIQSELDLAYVCGVHTEGMMSGLRSAEVVVHAYQLLRRPHDREPYFQAVLYVDGQWIGMERLEELGVDEDTGVDEDNLCLYVSQELTKVIDLSRHRMEGLTSRLVAGEEQYMSDYLRGRL
ncbi:hypothetical protein OG413_45050 [Streptomyces sp. NBC_01433]|uniref:hypothetical protein n=1 Tax=Streptomyces sp. NBC_01433 TaxID=2903864 RepID=UPI0022536E66|nr:hypothetical protein [Streptomyces sp. NBC_01433]MCX4682355.1 hypothetical protein [Streptomyces sp. NBC_01433]